MVFNMRKVNRPFFIAARMLFGAYLIAQAAWWIHPLDVSWDRSVLDHFIFIAEIMFGLLWPVMVPLIVMVLLTDFSLASAQRSLLRLKATLATPST